MFSPVNFLTHSNSGQISRGSDQVKERGKSKRTRGKEGDEWRHGRKEREGKKEKERD